MRLSAAVLLGSLIALVLVATADPCGRRQSVNWEQQITHYRARPSPPIRKSVTIMANIGQPRTLAVGQKYMFCGCDKSGTCVIYGGGPLANPGGTTFFANVPSYALGIPKGKTMFSRWRGALPISVKPKKIKSRAIIATDLRQEGACHGGPNPKPGLPPTAINCDPIWEYTYLGGGMFVTGAESPASWWVHGKKIGLGYNTGLFTPRDTFYDMCVTKLQTPVRKEGAPFVAPWIGTGKLTWVFGYVRGPTTKAPIYTWMIESVEFPGEFLHGNIM